eukprot:gb/GECG01007700.1/.p1 GENE.gb/GECG01007700.1/~~gb/GECG01007700.1/.p1  ORF type:complete len:1226 (+),score=144.21 gb/GECG01007700.1/:1-3678(+)
MSSHNLRKRRRTGRQSSRANATQSLECKIYVSFNRNMAPKDALKELLSNAYDAHIMSGIAPKKVRTSLEKTTSPGGHIWTVQNSGEAITHEAFNMQESKKQYACDITRNCTGALYYPQGHFGQGLKRGLSRLLAGGLSVVYETPTAAYIFVPSSDPETRRTELQCVMSELNIQGEPPESEHRDAEKPQDADMVLTATCIVFPSSSNEQPFTRTHVLSMDSLSAPFGSDYAISSFEDDVLDAKSMFLYGIKDFEESHVFTATNRRTGLPSVEIYMLESRTDLWINGVSQGGIKDCKTTFSYNIIIPPLKSVLFGRASSPVQDLARRIPADRSPVPSTYVSPVICHGLTQLCKLLVKLQVTADINSSMIPCIVETITLFHRFEAWEKNADNFPQMKRTALSTNAFREEAESWQSLSACRTNIREKLISKGLGNKILEFLEHVGANMKLGEAGQLGEIEDKKSCRSQIGTLQSLYCNGRKNATKALQQVRQYLYTLQEKERANMPESNDNDDESMENGESETSPETEERAITAPTISQLRTNMTESDRSEDEPVEYGESRLLSETEERASRWLNDQIAQVDAQIHDARPDTTTVTLYGGSSEEQEKAREFLKTKHMLEGIDLRFIDVTESEMYKDTNHFARKSMPLKQFMSLAAQGSSGSSVRCWINSDLDVGQSFLFARVCCALQEHGMANIDVKLETDAPESCQIRKAEETVVINLPRSEPSRSIYHIRLESGFCSRILYLTSMLNGGADRGTAEVRGAHFRSLLRSYADSFRQTVTSLNSRSNIKVEESSDNAACVHILCLIDYWGRNKGGVPVFNQNMCECFQKMPPIEGKHVYVTCVANEGHPQQEDPASNLRVIFPPQIPGVDAKSALALIDEECISSQSFTYPVDIVIGHDRFTGAAAVTVANRLQAKSVLIQHVPPKHVGIVKDQWDSKYEAIDKELRNLANSAHIAVSSGNAAEDTLGPSYDKFFPGLPCPNDYDSLREQRSHPCRVAFVGRVDDPVKGGPILDPLKTKLSEKFGESIAVHQIGGQVTEDLILGKTVHPTYHAAYTEDRYEYVKMLRRCKCLILPSLVEAFGLVVVDAVANNVPVVVTQRSGVGQYLRSLLKVIDCARTDTKNEQTELQEEFNNARTIMGEQGGLQELEQLRSALQSFVVDINVTARDEVSSACVEQFTTCITSLLANPATTSQAIRTLKRIWPSEQNVFRRHLCSWLDQQRQCEQPRT